MNRFVIKVAGPALLIGLALSVTCLAAAWLINRTQREMARLLPGNVSAVEHAQQLEIELRELRFLLLQQRLKPTPELRQQIDAAHAEIEAAFAASRSAVREDEQTRLLDQIEREYRAYRAEEAGHPRPFRDFTEVRSWIADHPVADASEPCRKLLEINNREMREAVSESGRVSRWVQAGLLLLCLLGPVSGFVGGYGTARGMHQSITRMLILVRDVHARLDEEVGLLDVGADPSLHVLDTRLQRFADRVGEVTRQVQRQQQEILRTEQLAAVGQLAAGVAHEIRNPLMGIKLLVESALRGPDRTGLSADDLGMIHRELLRLERTVQGLLDFARPPKPHLDLADLRQAVLQAAELARPKARFHDVDIDLHLPEAPVMVRHDTDQIAGVVTNLVLNALDVLGSGGRVEIRLIHTPGKRASITIQDTGPGINPDLLPRLFIPFTSTKPTGSGLGLSVSRRVARQHGGDLTAANVPDGGACFTLDLPDPMADNEG